MEANVLAVATQIQRKEEKAIYLHCYAHFPNLACQDSIRRSQLMNDALDTISEVTKIICMGTAANGSL